MYLSTREGLKALAVIITVVAVCAFVAWMVVQ